MFHCLVIKVFRSVSQTARLFYLISNHLSSTFSTFSNSFLMNFCLADSLFTLSCLQAFVNKFFYFFEKFIFFKKIAEKEGFEPSRRVSDLYP